MADHLQQLLASAIKASSRPLKEINYLGAQERQELLLSFNSTQADYPLDETILDLLSGQLRRTPDATALLFEDRSLSYRELHERLTSWVLIYGAVIKLNRAILLV